MNEDNIPHTAFESIDILSKAVQRVYSSCYMPDEIKAAFNAVILKQLNKIGE